MENASKALLMAVGVLIVILILSVFMYFVNQVSDFKKSNSDAVKDSQLATFNEQFTQYARNDLKGVEIISLVNKVVNYNKKSTGAGEINYSQKITLKIAIGQEFKSKYASDVNLELFKNDPYEISTDENNELIQIVNSQKALEDKYTLKMLDKMSSNYEALKTYYTARTDAERSSGKSVKDVTGKDYGIDNSNYQQLLDNIIQHREYSEFKTATFQVVGSPTYIDGQISRMEFKYKK